MEYIICDITGRTINYDEALCSAIQLRLTQDEKLVFWSQGGHSPKGYLLKRFRSVVPNKYKNSSKRTVLFLKAFDTICAYTCLLFRFLFKKPRIFHLQWLPFLSLGVRGAFIDIFFLKLLRRISKSTKFVFTIHNMCPHGMKEEQREGYNVLFIKALKIFDRYIVHTNQTKLDVCQVFGLDEQKVNIVFHGVFVPEGRDFNRKKWNRDDVRLIMYGTQNWYKGPDVFVRSLQLVSDRFKPHIHAYICGVVDKEMQEACKDINTGVDIKWDNYYLTDEQLYNRIEESDIIILPYRRISQSGVLLLALSTKRIIITSNLPTFKETLDEYDPSLFFESENPKSLAVLIERYMNDEVDRNSVLERLSLLENKYSWKNSASCTINLYRTI